MNFYCVELILITMAFVKVKHFMETANWEPENIHYTSICFTRFHCTNSAHHNDPKNPHPPSMMLEQTPVRKHFAANSKMQAKRRIYFRNTSSSLLIKFI
jgi:hypothetical protein